MPDLSAGAAGEGALAIGAAGSHALSRDHVGPGLRCGVHSVGLRVTGTTRVAAGRAGITGTTGVAEHPAIDGLVAVSHALR